MKEVTAVSFLNPADLNGEFDVVVYAHSHKPKITRDAKERLYINPGETSGWGTTAAESRASPSQMRCGGPQRWLTRGRRS